MVKFCRFVDAALPENKDSIIIPDEHFVIAVLLQKMILRIEELRLK